jgi:arylsulfatase A
MDAATWRALLVLCVATPCAPGCGGDDTVHGPNIILIFTDDQGWGDLGVQGSTTLETPHLDAMAAEGVRLTRFYAGNAVCTPSRAILLTGRHGPRQQLEGTTGGVYFPFTSGGMDPEQLTLADLLSDAGYDTALIGKWHLGHEEPFLPGQQGFRTFFGLPYSNDMQPLPLLDGGDTLRMLPEHEDQADLTPLYVERIKAVIDEADRRGRPFFIYHPTHAPHIPLVASARFAGTSPTCDEVDAEQACGDYADVMAELDWSVGEILAHLRDTGHGEDTLVIFTSDNGPWLIAGRGSGSAGPFHQGKGTTFEGGFRVPTLAWWPGTIRQGAVDDTAATMMDWFPTIASVAGTALPSDRTFDGHDLLPLLQGEGPRDPTGEPFQLVYYRIDNETPGAYAEGHWKYKAPVTGGEAPYASFEHDALLFDLDADPGEQHDLSAEHPDRLEALRTAMEARDQEIKADPLR